MPRDVPIGWPYCSTKAPAANRARCANRWPGVTRAGERHDRPSSSASVLARLDLASSRRRRCRARSTMMANSRRRGLRCLILCHEGLQTLILSQSSCAVRARAGKIRALGGIRRPARLENVTRWQQRRCGDARRLALAAVAVIGSAACSGGSTATAPAGKPLTIGVIPKGTTHEFWNAIHAGAVKAERELNEKGVKVSITWKGPLREDDREQQVQVVEGFLSQGMSGIVLAPLDEKALVRPGRGSQAGRHPDRRHRLGPGHRSDRLVCRDRQREGRRAGGRPDGRAARRQGQGAAAPVSGRIGQHDRARAGVPEATDGQVSRASR